MGRYYTFSKDALLQPRELHALQNPPAGYSDIENSLHVVAEVWKVAISDATKERWHRALHWSRALDMLLDESDVADPLDHYLHLTAALSPDPWMPNSETSRIVPDACTWANITRASFEDGDISNEHRRQMHATAITLGKVSTNKQTTTTIKEYIRTCKAEGALVADMLMDCMADDERQAPRAEPMREYFRQWGKVNTLADSKDDFVEDAANGIVQVPCDDKTFGILKRAATWQENKLFLCWPKRTTQAARMLTSLHKH